MALMVVAQEGQTHFLQLTGSEEVFDKMNSFLFAL